ncbi:MAG: hypothetical protein KUG81_10015 [Gammaproteobacteria bacterium]|nr:hypothetical protein [Gammaproteobacteria bacterium]
MIKNIQIFMLGYLVNAIIWRVDAGQMADIKYPAILSALCLLLIGIQSLKERKAH